MTTPLAILGVLPSSIPVNLPIKPRIQLHELLADGFDLLLGRQGLRGLHPGLEGGRFPGLRAAGRRLSLWRVVSRRWHRPLARRESRCIRNGSTACSCCDPPNDSWKRLKRQMPPRITREKPDDGPFGYRLAGASRTISHHRNPGTTPAGCRAYRISRTGSAASRPRAAASPPAFLLYQPYRSNSA